MLGIPRSSGVLLHPTSLPGRGVGDLGAPAYRFVDWLAGAGQALWQILPLVPVDAGGSPYNGLSALAGNPLLISMERLAEEGLLEPEELEDVDLPDERVDYPRVIAWKDGLLRRAFRAFQEGAAPELRSPFSAFRSRSRSWLDDYCLFRALREEHGGASWTEWEEPVRLREPAAVERWRERLATAVDRYAFQEFLFEQQWGELRAYANRRGVRLIGDIPIFVAHDSADVWAHRELFRLDEEGQPLVVAGVPPDYFSETGQRWGNPLFRWDVMEERGFRWWKERFRCTLEQADIARIDHFRGFEAYWEIPAENETALGGRWRPGPGAALFDAVEEELGRLPLIAEDLGLITPEVDALREQLGFPGMRVLQFAFDGDSRNPHLPQNHPVDSVSYPGTHDNDTVIGWWSGASEAERTRVRKLVPAAEAEVHWAMTGLAFGSRAHFAVVPVQDLLGLGNEGRMNTPGTGAGNWAWRLREADLTPEIQERLLELTRSTERGPLSPQEEETHEWLREP